MNCETRRIIREGLVNCKKYFGTLVFNLLYSAKRNRWYEDLSYLRNLVLSLPEAEKRKYSEECDYVENLALDELPSMMFPYEKTGKCAVECVSGVDHGYPYVVHGGKAKLYFPKNYPALGTYSNLMETEGLLGLGSLRKSPHSYQSPDFKVDDGDVLLDVGCAEALFALDNIEKISKAYLFECDKEWNEPLRRTFAHYKGKVVHINKFVSDKTERRSTTLMDIVRENVADGSVFFVKMDIEGWEKVVLKGNEEFFRTAKVKLSCCTYHRQDDARIIEGMLKSMGYETRFSDGYMLPLMNGIHYPYFRHGVIYAKNF